ncbi:MAG: hypothetical protein JMDDDDMK_04238 [Acidobacteria bacterium]|nr:hypothetical protein [Acidobacteriota bacterium]
MEVVTLRRHFVDALLHLLMLEDLDVLIAAQQQSHLFAGRERARVFGHRFERHHAFFRRGEIFLLGLAEPERAQTQSVATEDHFVAFARDDCDRALRQRSERAAEVAMERLERRVVFLALAPDGRKDDLDGFHQRQAVIEHEAFDHAVENLRVAGLRGQLETERGGLARQTVNRIDLAVVAERRKHLRLFSRRIRVGRIAPVTQRDRRFEFRFGEFGEITPQSFGVAANFVNRAGVAQRSDVDGQFAFERQMDMKRLAVAHSPRAARNRSDLPVTRLAGAAKRAEHFRPDLGVLREHDFHPARFDDFRRAPFDVVVIIPRGGGQQNVRDGEIRMIDR